MARVKLTLVCEECGQEFTHVHNCYNRDAADSYEEWAKENITVCPECYKKAQKAKADEVFSECFEAVKNIALATLEGTEKQVSWAESIRAKAVGSFLIKNAAQDGSEQVIIDIVNTLTDSTWWIDHRDMISYDTDSDVLEKTMVNFLMEMEIIYKNR